MPPPYTHFRMLGYEVPTVIGFDAPGRRGYASGWPAGPPVPAHVHIPVPAPAAEAGEVPRPGELLAGAEPGLPFDAYVRLLRLADVVESARQYVEGEGGPANVLNVFVVPEFYFRPPAALGLLYHGGTYPLNAANAIFKALGSMFRDDLFEDWLFVCGTVLWNTDTTQHVPASGTLDAKGVAYFNTCVVVSGGPASRLHTVEKQVPSHMDGIPQVEFTHGVPVYASPVNDPVTKPLWDRWEALREHVFDTRGVSVGVEVCLDHYRDHRVLRTVVQDPRSARPQGVDLHIVTAAGMVLQPSSMAARTGGYVLLVDGDAPPSAHLCRITRWSEADGGVAAGPVRGGEPDTVPVDAWDDAAIEPDSWIPTPPGLAAGTASVQQISVFPVLSL